MSLAAVVWLTGCATLHDRRQAEIAPGPVYDTAEQILAMPACTASVVEQGPCYLQLRTADGNEFFIGSPAAGAEVLQFVQELKEGRSYKFPEAFQKYQREHPLESAPANPSSSRQ